MKNFRFPVLLLSSTLLGLVVSSCSYLPLFETLNIPGIRTDHHRDYIEITPSGGPIHGVGLMFWPGGLVDPAAYIPSLGTFAARGYRVVIAKVPLNLAITQLDKGLVLARRLGGRWVAAGHSLGGTAASWMVHDNPEAFEGLALLAAYPTDDRTLAGWNRPVLAVGGEKDGLVTPEVMAGKRSLFPPEGTGPGRTVFIEIPGGNHAYFGSYGTQDKDGTALITPQEQWTALADALVSFWSNW